MKMTINLFLLVLYGFTIFKPVFPFVNYYINYDYIANVLCINKDKPEKKCHGKCHLLEEVAKDNDDRSEDKKSLPHDMEKFPTSFIKIATSTNLYYSQDDRFKDLFSIPLSKFKSEPVVPPPKVI